MTENKSLASAELEQQLDRTDQDTNTILIIDDDVDILSGVGDLLRSQGFVPIEFSDSWQALHLAMFHPQLHLVLTDVDMPGIDGISLVNHLQRVRPALPVLFMTADVNRLKAAGYSGEWFVQKPFTSSELIKKIADKLTDPC